MKFLFNAWSRLFPRRDLPRMVGWYSPQLLIKAAVEVVVSTLFGQHADQRTVQALTSSARLHDYSSGEEGEDIEIKVDQIDVQAQSIRERTECSKDFWFDYVADVGDGWNSTYSIAYQLTRPELILQEPNSEVEHKLKQGQILLFGGDQVYPIAAREEYDRRFLKPYKAALDDGNERSTMGVFAIPGNHDWYDSLKSFSRIFFTHSPFFAGAGWQAVTPQSRSYFAIKLPHDWVILATDVQLGSDIDANQIEYFRKVVAEIGPNARVILCTAEPHWTHPKKAEKGEASVIASVLDQLERKILGDRVKVFIAGDVHHYMRYQSADGIQKITAGGGGAFLHPTHRTWEKTLQTSSVQQDQKEVRVFNRIEESIYPSQQVSRWLGLWNLAFPILNPRFGLLTAILYLTFALMMLPAFKRLDDGPKEIAKAQKIQQELVRLNEEILAIQIEKESIDDFTLPKLWGAGPKSSADRSSKKISDLVNKQQKMIEELKQLGDPETNFIKNFAKRHHNPPAPNKELASPKKPPLSTPRDNELHLPKNMSFKTQPMGEGFRRANVPEGSQLSGGDDHKKSFTAATENEADERPAIPFWYLWALALQELKLPNPFESLLAVLVFVAVIAGFVMFTDIPNTMGRWVLGVLHGTTHWLCAYFITIGSVYALAFWTVGITWLAFGIGCVLIALYVLSNEQDAPYSFSMLALIIGLTGILLGILKFLAPWLESATLSIAIIVFIGGWFVGSFVMGIYLYMAHTTFGVHWNEAYSSIQCQDWKCFVRFKIDSQGNLTIFPIGIDKVCRSWNKPRGRGHVVPCSPNDGKPRLIERPIVITSNQN